MTRTAIAIRHVHFEDLGAFDGVLRRYGYAVTYCDAGIGDIDGVDPLSPDLIVVLGGPIGAYEELSYPFLGHELALLERRSRRTADGPRTRRRPQKRSAGPSCSSATRAERGRCAISPRCRCCTGMATPSTCRKGLRFSPRQRHARTRHSASGAVRSPVSFIPK